MQIYDKNLQKMQRIPNPIVPSSQNSDCAWKKPYKQQKLTLGFRKVVEKVVPLHQLAKEQTQCKLKFFLFLRTPDWVLQSLQINPVPIPININRSPK